MLNQFSNRPHSIFMPPNINIVRHTSFDETRNSYLHSRLLVFIETEKVSLKRYLCKKEFNIFKDELWMDQNKIQRGSKTSSIPIHCWWVRWAERMNVNISMTAPWTDKTRNNFSKFLWATRAHKKPTLRICKIPVDNRTHILFFSR